MSDTRRSSSAAPRGVNAAGYFRTESGVGEAARGYVRALQTLDIGVSLHDLSHLTGNRSEDQTLRTFDDDEYPFDINLVCADVEPHFAIVSDLGPDYFQDRYNIGVWAWELPRFPERWYDRFAYYDEIWVGTSFIANALSPISPLPVVRMPPVLTGSTGGSRQAGRRRIGAAPGEFVFLFVFDVHSHLERKNPLAVIEAFRRAFSPTEPVRLALKSVNARAAPDGFAHLAQRAQGHRISIWDGYWPAGDMRNLMAACDAYVSLHRSEGTGLTISEAMASAKPVIATGWSGNMDFMTVANSYPVAYDLVPITAPVGPYAAGELWAEPSVEHAAALMRHVYDAADEAAQRGQRACSDMQANYAPETIARLLEERLTAIETRRCLGQFRQRMWARFHDYRELGSRIGQVVDASLPADATILVVSRGDDGLLQLHGRRAWHFPQTPAGQYAGGHPADSSAAIAHLTELRARGADFLLFPSTALWWLDYYREFAAHLDAGYRKVVHRQDSCLIYSLKEEHTP